MEGDIVGPGTVNSVMTGKHYNRSVYSHKIMFEALERLRFEAFLATLTDCEQMEMQQLVSEIDEKFPAVTNVISDRLSWFLRRYNEFVDVWCIKNTTFALWSSYIKMAGTYVLLS